MQVSAKHTLPEDFTIETLFGEHESKPRNKNIAAAFYRAGFIESWGRGITKIRAGFKKAGLPPPKYETSMEGVRMTIYRNTNLVQETIVKNAAENQKYGQKTGQKTEKWPEKIQKILDAIKRDHSITISKLESELGIGHTTIKKMLNEMQKENFIRRVGADRGGHWEIIEK